MGESFTILIYGGARTTDLLHIIYYIIISVLKTAYIKSIIILKTTEQQSTIDLCFKN